MEIQSLLEANCVRLLGQYHTHLQDVRTLQETLICDILPSVVDEFELEPEAIEWAKEWLSDTCM